MSSQKYQDISDIKTEVDCLMLSTVTQGVKYPPWMARLEADACRKDMMARHEWTKTWSLLGGTSFRE